jgi:hypothetical protein
MKKLTLSLVSVVLVATGLALALNNEIVGHALLIAGSLLYIGITAPLNNMKATDTTKRRAKRTLTIIALVFSLQAGAQTTTKAPKPAPVEIADQTTIQKSTKTFRIVTTNTVMRDAIDNNLFDQIKGLKKTTKKDRFGMYEQCQYDFLNEDMDTVLKLIAHTPTNKSK